MRLTLHTDYALRVLIYVALRGDGLSTVSEIAARYDISRNHVVKVVHGLGRAGFLKTVRGRNGGVALARPAAGIVIADVVRATEDGLGLVDCLHAGKASCRIDGACALKDVFGQALAAFFQVLGGYTLADVVGSNPSLAARLDLTG